MSKKKVLVAGGGGFIGGHLTARLLKDGFQVRSVDVKPIDEWYQVFDDAENVVADLKDRNACDDACHGVDDVYNLAADMGGMGFIENNKALCMLSVLINTHLLQAALEAKASSASSTPAAPASTTPTSRSQRRRHSAQGRRRLSRDAGRRLRLGEAVLRADVPPLPRGLTACARAWPASTTSTARTAPGTAAARRPRPPSAAR